MIHTQYYWNSIPQHNTATYKAYRGISRLNNSAISPFFCHPFIPSQLSPILLFHASQTHN